MVLWRVIFFLTLRSSPILSESVRWPAGSYGIPKPASGCPQSDGFVWSKGWRSQTTHGRPSNSTKSTEFHLDGIVDGTKVKRSFCIKEDIADDGSRSAWPQGKYCIYKKRYQCPAGLTSGDVFWDDEDTWNTNRLGGTLPDGTYNTKTWIFFCCKTDGNKDNPILLPSKSPFFLLTYNSTKCQMVKWALATLEWIYFDTEDWNNQDQADGAYPHDAGKSPPTIYYCYYRGCNKTLTEVHGTFQSPNYPRKYPNGQYCSWRIMVNVTPHIHLIFTNFSLQNENNTDALYVYDGENATGEVLGVFYGSNPPPGGGIYSMTNHMFIIFKSDNQTGSYTGFNASYYGVNKSELDSKVTGTTAQTVKVTSTSPITHRTSYMYTLKETTPTSRQSQTSTRASPTEGPSKDAGKHEEKEQNQKTALRTKETNINKDAIYGPVIGVLALLLTASIINSVVKSHKRRRVDRMEEKPVGSHYNEATENEMRIENSKTTSHHNPSRYMVDEPRPSQARLQGATDTVTSSSMNNYAPPHPEKLTWEGSRTDTIIIGKITGEGTFEHVPQGKALQLRIEIKTEPKGATTHAQ